MTKPVNLVFFRARRSLSGPTPPATTYFHPQLANSIIYFGLANGNFYALNCIKGDLLWRYPTSNAVSDCSPAIAAGAVFPDGANDSYAFGPERYVEICARRMHDRYVGTA